MYLYRVYVQCCASDAINHAEVSCRVRIWLETELIDFLIQSVLFSICCFITDGGFCLFCKNSDKFKKLDFKKLIYLACKLYEFLSLHQIWKEIEVTLSRLIKPSGVGGNPKQNNTRNKQQKTPPKPDFMLWNIWGCIPRLQLWKISLI